MGKFNLGQLVTVQGKISVFREQRQLTVDLICIHPCSKLKLIQQQQQYSCDQDFFCGRERERKEITFSYTLISQTANHAQLK